MKVKINNKHRESSLGYYSKPAEYSYYSAVHIAILNKTVGETPPCVQSSRISQLYITRSTKNTFPIHTHIECSQCGSNCDLRTNYVHRKISRAKNIFASCSRQVKVMHVGFSHPPLWGPWERIEAIQMAKDTEPVAHASRGMWIVLTRAHEGTWCMHASGCYPKILLCYSSHQKSIPQLDFHDNNVSQMLEFLPSEKE